jgi:hypothetical protein
MIVLTEDLNTISEGIPLGYKISDRSEWKPTELNSCSSQLKESLEYVMCILGKLNSRPCKAE